MAKNTSVNLITPKTLSHFAIRRTKRVWKRVATTALIITISSTFWLVSATNKIQKQIAAEVDSGNGPRRVLAKHQQLQQYLSKLSQVEREQMRLRSKHSPLSLFALLTDIKDQLDGELEVERIDYALDKLQLKAASSSSGKVTLQMVTTSTIKSSSVIEKLTHCGFFRDVQLSTALVKADAATEDLRFSVACKF
ncbi:MAG: hypothetical protein Aurels2KO_13770 [Aureliella sp.]